MLCDAKRSSTVKERGGVAGACSDEGRGGQRSLHVGQPILLNLPDGSGGPLVCQSAQQHCPQSNS